MKRKSEKGLARVLVGVAVGGAALGVMLFFRELPALRRYLRIERM